MGSVDQLDVIDPPNLHRPAQAPKPDVLALAALGVAASVLVLAASRKTRRARLPAASSPAVVDASPAQPL